MDANRIDNPDCVTHYHHHLYHCVHHRMHTEKTVCELSDMYTNFPHFAQ